MNALEVIAIIVGILAGTAGVAGFFLGIANYLHQRAITHPRVVVRPSVGAVHHSQSGWEENVPLIEVLNVGQVPVIGATVGFLGRRSDDKVTIISEYRCINHVEWLGELKPQHAVVLRFDMADLPETHKLGQAFAVTIIGDEFRASRRDMRKFAKQRKAASS